MSLFSFVVQEIVAALAVILEEDTEEMTGGVVSGKGDVVKVWSAETAKLPEASLDLTLK